MSPPLPDRAVPAGVSVHLNGHPQCPECRGRFLKTLEMRYVAGTGHADKLPVILSKKRCKRCKLKTIFEKSDHGWRVCASLSRWQGARLFLEHRRGPVFLEHRTFVSEYSAKISQDVSQTLGYLKRVAALQKPFHPKKMS